MAKELKFGFAPGISKLLKITSVLIPDFGIHSLICFRVLVDGHQQTPSSQPGLPERHQPQTDTHWKIHHKFTSMRRCLQLAIVKPYIMANHHQIPWNHMIFHENPMEIHHFYWRNPMETVGPGSRSLPHHLSDPSATALPGPKRRRWTPQRWSCTVSLQFSELKSQNSLLWSRIYRETIGISLVFGGGFCSSTIHRSFISWFQNKKTSSIWHPNSTPTMFMSTFIFYVVREDCLR